jgi:hypothetical protein
MAALKSRFLIYLVSLREPLREREEDDRLFLLLKFVETSDIT